jgi:hypothetical protein
MRRLIQKSLLAVPVLALGLSILFGSLAQAANPPGAANLYLSPASGNYAIGDTVAIDIYESSTDSINAVQANLSYNPSVLTFSGISSSSAFDSPYQSNGGGGTVQIARGAYTPVTGAKVVATVSFTAAAGGSSTVSFTSGSAVVRAGDGVVENLTTTDGNYAVSAPATPPATPPPASPGSPPASPPASPSTPHKTTPPPASPGSPPASPTSNPTASPSPSSSSNSQAPSAISVSNVTGKTATITWTTAVPTTTELDYGLNDQYGVSVVDPKLVTNHSVVLSSKILIPGSTFHYMIKGLDASGKLITSGDKTFATAKTGAGAKKSGAATGTIVAAIVVLGLLAAGGGSFWWVKNGGSTPQWSGYEPAVKPQPITSPGAPAGQVVKPAGLGEVKPGENIIKPGPGPTPPPA